MKKLFYIAAIFASLISFVGCYADRAVVYERPPARRVMLAPAPYYYHPAPVIIESYRGRSYYNGRSRHNAFSNRYRRY